MEARVVPFSIKNREPNNMESEFNMRGPGYELPLSLEGWQSDKKKQFRKGGVSRGNALTTFTLHNSCIPCMQPHMIFF